MTVTASTTVLALKDADIAPSRWAPVVRRPRAGWRRLSCWTIGLPRCRMSWARAGGVIGNIARVASLFLTKTVYSVLLALLVGMNACSPSLLKRPTPLLYPFQPIHVTIAAWFTIGIPSFNPVAGTPTTNALTRASYAGVLSSALPSGLVVGVATFASYLGAYHGRHATFRQQDQASTAALITLLVTALWVLAVAARPYPLVALWRWWFSSGLAICGDLQHPACAGEIPARPVEPGGDVGPRWGSAWWAPPRSRRCWWIRARMLGVQPRLWREPATAAK